jgi:hypothetical protein
MLKYTSCLFATIVVHAYYARLFTYHHLFLAVTILSILNHATRDPLIRNLDIFAAHLAYAWIILETPFVLIRGVWGLLCFPLSVGCIWIVEITSENFKDELHAALHCVSVAGVHMYMYVLYGDQSP